MEKSKMTSPVGVIFKRELAAYFTSPIAYIVTGLFLIFSAVMFFSTFFIIGRADLRNFFGLLPLLFAFFIPALTMRTFSEETRSGSIETLMTLPVTSFDVVLGKYLASFVCSCSMLIPTLFYVLTACIFGSPDFGPILGGYIGAIFLLAGFTAIGIFASSLTNNQIVAFFIAFSISILLAMIDSFLFLLPSVFVDFLGFFSAGSHFASISRGILDSRDLLYFISLTVLFFAMTVKSLSARRTA